MTAGELVLESADRPEAITNWYEEKIKSENMNTTSYVLTTTNGNVLNSLVSSNGKKEISIQILKKNEDTLTTIKVSTKPFAQIQNI